MGGEKKGFSLLLGIGDALGVGKYTNPEDEMLSVDNVTIRDQRLQSALVCWGDSRYGVTYQMQGLWSAYISVSGRLYWGGKTYTDGRMLRGIGMFYANVNESCEITGLDFGWAEDIHDASFRVNFDDLSLRDKLDEILEDFWAYKDARLLIPSFYFLVSRLRSRFC